MLSLKSRVTILKFNNFNETSYVSKIMILTIFKILLNLKYNSYDKIKVRISKITKTRDNINQDEKEQGAENESY